MRLHPLGAPQSAPLLAILLMWAHFAPPAAAQAPSDAPPQPLLQGVVIDQATEQPVAAATVALVGTDVAVATGRWGSFAFPDVPAGSVALHVSAPGHPSVVLDVEVVEGRIAFVRVVLPSVAAVLAELLVGASPAGPMESARTAADLLALEVPRARVSSGIVGLNDFRLQLRPTSTFMGNAEPLILIDGVVMTRDRALDALERIPASDVESVEVLKGPAAAFLYPYAASGVVVVRTKKGRRSP